MKYVLLFAIVGSLESLLTVKAIDAVDPYKRKSNANKDLMAVGFGNVVSSILGGLPMIAEVARSSANVNNGGKTRWSNFYHGVFMLVFLVLDLQFSEIIPFSALAAMLIGVGIKLASPKEFGRMAKIGPEQLLVFCVTIVATLATDLLIGITVGVAVKLLSQWILGVPLINVFKASIIKEKSMLTVFGAAVFSNWLGLKKVLDVVPRNQTFTVDLSYCHVVDHTVMNNLLHIEKEFSDEGGVLSVVGLDDFISVSKSNHQLSTRTKSIRNIRNKS
ncbi:MAG: SulP family inorganic anion transporter [Sphingomonadales bacterium]|nr:SulP family inorganic anion transporter [Sphingomonadales bacterium]